MAKVKARCVTTIAGHGFSYSQGGEYEVDADNEYLRKGFLVADAPPAKPKAKAKAKPKKKAE